MSELTNQNKCQVCYISQSQNLQVQVRVLLLLIPVVAALAAQGPVPATHAARVKSGNRVNYQVTANSLKMKICLKLTLNE